LPRSPTYQIRSGGAGVERCPSRIDSLRGDEPWPGYDELSVDEVRSVLSEGDEQRIRSARAYERKHKTRAGVIQATERELSKA
jgi:hypothetical protein